jgi:manganese-dependent ADP-ribose/CDP-alcohol diphosphatase
VVATLAGHAHRYGLHHCTSSGITHRVLEAVLEAPPGANAYGWIDVFHDRLVLRGQGIMKDMVVDFSSYSSSSSSSSSKQQQQQQQAEPLLLQVEKAAGVL